MHYVRGMTNTPPPYLAWIDLETTGTDARQDPILEIGLIVTTSSHPFDVLAQRSIVIRPDGDSWSHRFGPYVLEMHTKNGLLADVFAGGASMAEAVEEMCAVLDEIGKPHEFVLAGSGVAHFDRRFIDEQMPALSRWLRYYTVDVGVLRRSLVAIGLGSIVEAAETVGNYGATKEHRGFADIEGHLAEMRFYADRLALAGVPSLPLVETT